MDYSKDQLEQEMTRSSKHYSDNKFWDKVKKYAKKAGTQAVYTVLLLYYVLQKDTVPMKTKGIIIGALGYFILPLDLIPDFTPVVGYADDLGTLGLALMQVMMYIDQDVKKQAKDKLVDLFSEDVDTSEVDSKLN
ncbi:YkvA family protein [Bacillus nitratireducens]|uniref:YkvA family protein n=1 Tax=Bacillus nitratireducens TaxID=2026193 RepID=UPI0039BF2701